MEIHEQQTEIVYRSRTRKACLKHALVLEAVGIDYLVRKESGEFTLATTTADAELARTELDAYTKENRDWPTRAATFPHLGSGWGGVVGYAAVLMLVDVLVRRETFDFNWFAAGKTNAGLIRDGQWWLTITALTLHVDLSHLLSNVVIGGLVGLFAGQLLGSGLAWLSILAAGAAGNLVNAWIHPPTHTSVGASTAVFAALGIVAAYAWKRRRHMQVSRFTRWAPLVGGFILLGYLGTGGVRTDVTAHVAGFVCGVLLGALYGTLGDRMAFSSRTQFLLGLGALAVLVCAWALALAPQVA